MFIIWKGSVTYGLMADISLLHCLVGGEVYLIASKGPKTQTGISNARAEILGIIVKVRRSSEPSKGTAYWSFQKLITIARAQFPFAQCAKARAFSWYFSKIYLDSVAYGLGQPSRSTAAGLFLKRELLDISFQVAGFTCIAANTTEDSQ